MIIEYYRPKQIDEALKLLQRDNPKTLPLGGGNVLSKGYEEDIAVVDLQDLGMNEIHDQNGEWIIGSTTTIQMVYEQFRENEAFQNSVRIDMSRNSRQTGTFGGFLQCVDGRSALLTLLLAVDAKIKWLPQGQIISLGDWLPQRDTWNEGKLISEISWGKNSTVLFDSIGRSPVDKPIVCCAIARWPSGRLRVAAGGFGKIPQLAMDGDLQDDIGLAIKNIYHQADDQWASAEYRKEAGAKLSERLLRQICE